MKIRTITLCIGVVATCLVAGIMIYRNQEARDESLLPKIRSADNSTAISKHLPLKPRASDVIKETPAMSKSLATKVEVQPATAPAPTQNSVTNRPAKEPLYDPIARDALALVGSDPEAELYWLAAINDLTLPPHEREDLIEDLNEEGLPDPQHPTLEDLPLILNRLTIIELIGPDAADEVNADAFMEAYKDLLNLAELAMGGGEPVR